MGPFIVVSILGTTGGSQSSLLYGAGQAARRDVAPLEAKARRSVVILGASISLELFIKGAKREDIDLRCILIDSGDVRASGRHRALSAAQRQHVSDF
jgi:hypothetical protein